MLPIFHVNTFKPWAPPHTKPFSTRKSLNSSTSVANDSPPLKLRHDSHASTLPVSKHRLPARPPAQVCVHISTNTQPCTPLSCQSQSRKIFTPPPKTPHSESPKHGATEHRISNSDPVSSIDSKDITDVLIEPPFFRGDTAEDGPSSPSISSSDDSLEEFLRLPVLQNNIPIDPVILADDGAWKASDLHLPLQQGDSPKNPGAICPYPEPPPILRDTPDHHRGSSEGPGSQNGNAQTSDHPRIQGHRQLHPSRHNTETDASYSSGTSGTSETSHIREQSKCSKRKTQRSGERTPKRLRVLSTLPSREDSFTALRSHFLYLPLDERLQFLSWLFEGALPRCMPGAGPTTCEDRKVRSTRHSTPLYEVEQTQGDRGEAPGSSRKGMRWSTEEVDLILKLRKDERRPWFEVGRLFSVKYPGRSLGSIQVYWSTTLKERADSRGPG